MSKVCFAALLFCLVALDARSQDDLVAREPAAPSIQISPESSPAPGAASEATPAPPPPQMRVTIAAASKVDGKPQIAYRSTAPNIFVRWRGENLPVGSVVRLAWIAEDVGGIVEPNFVIDRDLTVMPSPTFSARFTISRPSDGWAPGKYRVDLYVDDVLRDTLGITIHD